MDNETEALHCVSNRLQEEVSLRVLANKRRRNGLVPWATLPVELQVQVFLHAAEEGNGWPSLAQTTVISSVSFHWRAVAVETPRLWSFVDPALLGTRQSSPISFKFCTVCRESRSEDIQYEKLVQNAVYLQASASLEESRMPGELPDGHGRRSPASSSYPPKAGPFGGIHHRCLQG